MNSTSDCPLVECGRSGVAIARCRGVGAVAQCDRHGGDIFRDGDAAAPALDERAVAGAVHRRLRPLVDPAGAAPATRDAAVRRRALRSVGAAVRLAAAVALVLTLG